jgi:hypothetical protein
MASFFQKTVLNASPNASQRLKEARHIEHVLSQMQPPHKGPNFSVAATTSLAP